MVFRCFFKQKLHFLAMMCVKVYLHMFLHQILERPSIGEYWNIFGVPVLRENVISTFFRHDAVCYFNGSLQYFVESSQNPRSEYCPNTRVPVSERKAWSNTFSRCL